MSFHHGKGATVLLGTVDLSSYLNSVDLSTDLETADSTTFHATWKTAVAGTPSGVIELGGFYDPDEASLPTMILAAGSGVVTVCPTGGAAIGDSARTAAIFDTSYAESVPVGGIIAMKASLAVDGPVGFGYMLHPLAEDTNDTIGATRNDGAGSVTGWTATLHVLAVDGGSWNIQLQDDAASDMSGVLTVTSFPAVTVPVALREVSATSVSALRRYVRYFALRTGGSAGDGVTFALAISRNR